MELEITTTLLKKVVKIAVLLVLVAGLVFAVKWALPRFGIGVAAATPTPDQAEQAAIEGVEAFFGIDAQKGVDAWVKRMCALTTPEGCAVYQAVLKGWAQKQMSAHPDLNNQATVEQVEFVGETNQHGTVYRLYRVVVRFSHPWDGVDGLKGNVLTAYALVQEDGNIWRFAAPLNEQDAQRYMPKQ